VGLRLAKAGYCGGDPEKVLQMKIGWVMAMLQYEKFVGDYENTYIEMNKGKDH
jgi:hypothetical protein